MRDGPVPRETHLEKGRRYASEARLTIHHVSERRVRASCKGSGTIENIAREVAKAGFGLGKSTVQRRRVAVEGLPVTGEPSTARLGSRTQLVVLVLGDNVLTSRRTSARRGPR